MTHEQLKAAQEGWKEATIAWSVCASIHQKWGKGRDDVFTTRQADFVKHENDARARYAELAAAHAQRADVQIGDGDIESVATSCGGRWDGDHWVFEDADFHPFIRTVTSSSVASLTARVRELEEEGRSLRAVMVAAAEEIQAHWDAHCDAEGYGPANLMHRLEQGIASEYGYTAGLFAKQADRIARLEGLCKQAEEALRGLLDARHAGRLVPLDVASRGICAQVVHNGESALAALASLRDTKGTP